jgi:LPS sulfotransferase NodH
LSGKIISGTGKGREEVLMDQIKQRYTELQLSDKDLDQEFVKTSTFKVIICTSPRSGSFFLCRQMLLCGLGVPHEYFNPLHISIMGPRLGITELNSPFALAEDSALLKKYLMRLSERRTLNGVFAIKLQNWEFEKFLSTQAAKDLFDGAWFVHLYRNDLLSQAISLHFAALTGKWGFDDLVTTPPYPDPDFFHFDEIDRKITFLSNEHHAWRCFFARNGLQPFEICYEQFCSMPRQILQELAAWIGVSGELLSFELVGLEERSDSKEQRELPAKSAVRRQYLRSRQAIIPGGNAGPRSWVPVSGLATASQPPPTRPAKRA